MLLENEQDRQHFFQEVMSGAPDTFLEWAGHYFYNEAKIRLVPMPWDQNPAAEVAAKAAGKVKVTKAAQTGINASFNDLDLSAAQFSKQVQAASKLKYSFGIKPDYMVMWFKVADAPLVKKKAYHPVGLKVKIGSLIQYQYSETKVKTGIIQSCGKNFVKVKECNENCTAVFGSAYFIGYDAINNVGKKMKKHVTNTVGDKVKKK